MALRFIGNKSKLLPFIIDKVKKETQLQHGSFLDLFTGTATVAQGFKQAGFNVTANDKLYSSEIYGIASLLVNEEPNFENVLESIKVIDITNYNLVDTPYDKVLSYLNSLKGEEGFFYTEYSPINKSYGRKYFTEENAKKIDAVRNQINLWDDEGKLWKAERSLLIASLIQAVNKIANISGTYGAYLKNWYNRSQEPLYLERYSFFKGSNQYQVFRTDANEFVKNMEHYDIVYIDPPYTKRQYNTYYHIPETLAIGDSPEVEGVTGLRTQNASDKSQYCYKKRASSALRDLIENIKSDHIFLSYSNDGHISHDELVSILEEKGTLSFWEINYKRFRSNNTKNGNNSSLNEVLYYVRVNKSRSE